MSFLRANIDRAIVMTQFDLRGFVHPLGFRSKRGQDRKGFSFIPDNMVCFALGFGGENREPTDQHADLWKSTYQDYLVMCEKFAADCEGSQKEAIELIVRDIVAQANEMKSEVAFGVREPSHYLFPLEKDNWWGKSVLALAEAFGVDLEKEFEAKTD